MVKYSSVALIALISLGCEDRSAVQAFSTAARCQSKLAIKASCSSSSSALHASLPPMIIGPMLKKMREEQEKKKMPMASDEEQAEEAPGLRVGGGAWKWPPVWPYDNEFFLPNEDLSKPPDMAKMASMMSGTTSPDDVPVPEVEEEEKEKFDYMAYWAEEKSDVKTELDADAAEKLKSHYSFYLRDGMSVMEFGAAEESYLPDGLKLSRHVGIGANKKLMQANPALTESHLVDLNDVEVEKGVNSDVLRQIASEQLFDVIIMANTIDFLMHPREVFKTAWYMLKPGGLMLVPYSNKKAYSDKFQRAQTKMWRDFTEDQHMWVAGSFFQFSAGEGWEGLKGFDISPDGAKEMNDSGPLSFLKQGKDNNLYVVQATKVGQNDSIDPEDPEAFFKAQMWMLPTMEDRDKALVSPRMKRAYEFAETEEQRQALEKNIDTLPIIYESLLKMDQFAFTFNMQAQLAVDIALDPDFKGNEDQVIAMKQGLGLRMPNEFWSKIGQLTGAMEPDDKINLLAYIVPRFGSDAPEQHAALESFVTGLEPTFALIQSKCPSMEESDVQLLGTELLAAEILKPGRSTRRQFAEWVNAMTESELRFILSRRKAIKEEASTELAEYRRVKAEEEAAREALRKRYDEQIEEARKVRTMAFNPKTGRFQELPKKK